MPTVAASTQNRYTLFSGRDLRFLTGLSILVVAVGLRGIGHFGFVGQDFGQHRGLILSFSSEPLSDIYRFTNPPGLYWFGSLIHDHLSASYYLVIVATCFLALNVSALWLVFAFLWQSLSSWQLRYGAAAFVSLIPLRVIHSIVIAADAFTVPIFALIAFFTICLFCSPTKIGAWVGVSICLTVGMLCKYTFSGTLPPIALLLGYAIAARCGQGKRLAACVAGALSLALPSVVFLLEMHESHVQKGVMNYVWLRKGQPPVMRWRDVVLPKESDINLLSAPGYFRDRLFEVRKFSYPGLLHIASVTDSMDIFQKPPADFSVKLEGIAQDPPQRGRTQVSQLIQAWAAKWCLPFSVMAVAGTLFCGGLICGSLPARRWLLPDATIVVAALSAGFYLPVFLSLTRLNNPYSGAFWYPRLVLPAILGFYSLGFVAVDLVIDRYCSRRPVSATVRGAIFGYTLVACITFVAMLW